MYFYPAQKPPPPQRRLILQSNHLDLFKPFGCLPLKCLLRTHQRWTRQLLRRSALLSRPSTLKLVSLLLALGASLGLHPPLTNNNGVMHYWKGGHNCERNCRIPRINPPGFCTKAKVAKGGGGGGGAYLLFFNIHIICGAILSEQGLLMSSQCLHHHCHHCVTLHNNIP